MIVVFLMNWKLRTVFVYEENFDEENLDAMILSYSGFGNSDGMGMEDDVPFYNTSFTLEMPLSSTRLRSHSSTFLPFI